LHLRRIDVQLLKINLYVYRPNKKKQNITNLPAGTVTPIVVVPTTIRTITTTVKKTPPVEKKGLLYYLLHPLSNNYYPKFQVYGF